MKIEFETPKELAQRTGWTETRVRLLVKNKRLRHHKVGGSILIPVGALDELLKSTEIEPQHAPSKERLPFTKKNGARIRATVS